MRIKNGIARIKTKPPGEKLIDYPDHRRPKRKFFGRLRDARIQRFRKGLLEAAPNLDDDKYRPVVESFARLTIMIVDSYEFITKSGIIAPKSGELRPSMTVLRQLMDSQLRMAIVFGVTPAAEASDTIDLSLVGERVRKLVEKQSKLREQYDDSSTGNGVNPKGPE